MAVATVMIVGGAAWLRFAPPSSIEPPAVGSVLPPLRLLDLQSSEPLVLLGLKGKNRLGRLLVAGFSDGPGSAASTRKGLEALEVAWAVQHGGRGR